MLAVYQEGDKPVPGYQLVKFLGRGGFGQVWKARAPGGTEVALKLIDLQGHQGIKEFRAIRLVKTIRHPNLAPILAFWLKDQAGKLIDDDELDGSESVEFLERKPAELIIAMGLGDKNLLNRLEECKKQKQSGVPVAELLKYIESAAEAIDFLNGPTHDLGKGQVAIHHGDIKPQNILIVGGAAQVCDFGLASVLGDARSTNPTASFAYVAPETLDNKPTKWTDQYSLAISYYELRTGELPFPAANMPMILRAHAEGKLDLSRLPPSEQAVIKRATDLTPAKRYPTTVEMAKALRRAVEGTRGPSVVAAGPDGLLRLEPGLELVPGYKLVKHLGSGSYGKVWEASAPGGIHVALKIIEQLTAATGKQEFKALELIKRVEHNHLMDLLAYWLLDADGQLISDEDRAQADGRQPATLIIACKLAKTNLAQRLKECQSKTGQGIPPLELLRYMRQAAKAIDHLNTPQHKLDDEKVVSIQHRDIKPENILLAGDAVKVADFGLAKIVEGTSALVHSGSAGLTLAYAAPEMFENKVTQWTDQYCLALTYHHLRTGTLPFASASSPNEIIAAHLYGKLDLSRLAPEERKVIARATSTLPELRYPSCADMVEGLYHAVFGSEVEDDSYLLEKAAAERLSGAHAATPPLFPLDAATPTQTIGPEAAAATAAAHAGVAAPRPGSTKGRAGSSTSREQAARPRPNASGGETHADVMEGTLQPAQFKKSQATTLPPPPSQLPRPPRSRWLMPAVGGGIGMLVVAVVAVTIALRSPKPIASRDSRSGSNDSRSAEPPTTPSSGSVPPTRPAPPVQPGVDSSLQRGKELLAGNPQEALKVFSNLEGRTDLTADQRRQALIGAARADARLDQWNEVEQLLKRIQGDEFQSLETGEADRANINVLNLLHKERNFPSPEVLKLLTGMRKDQSLGKLEGWEKNRIGQVARDTVQRITQGLQDMSPREAAALAGELIALQAPQIELYRALAKSVINRQNAPANTEAGLDEQLQGVLELFAKPTVDDADKKDFNDWFGRVLARDIQWRIRFADGNTNWNARLEKCQKAQPTGWVLACRAECLLQTNGNLEEAWKNATDAKVEKETGDYGKYVRARIVQAEKGAADALKMLVQLSPYSPWLAAGDAASPRYRGKKAAEILLSDIATFRSDVQKADLMLAADPNLKPETLDRFFETIRPVIHRVVRAAAFDPAQTRSKLEPFKQLLPSFAKPLSKLADRALKSDQPNRLDVALECAQGFKAFGGDPIEAAELLGIVYGERGDAILALQAFDEGLPRDPNTLSQFDLEKLKAVHLGLLLQRSYLFADRETKFPREVLPTPEAVIQPAEAAIRLAGNQDKGEANGAAGYAFDYAAREWADDSQHLKDIGPWRLAAINRCLEALRAPASVIKKRDAWKWRKLIAIQVDKLLDIPATARDGEDYRTTAVTQLREALQSADTPADEKPDLQDLLNRLEKKAK